MKIIVTGRGTSGSWAIRGEQLGRAIGATVLANALNLSGFDLAVAVKRVPPDLLCRIRAARLPLVYDIVDGWPQPGGNDWDRVTCLGWLRQKIAEVRPIALVAATQVMANDCAEFGIPTLVLPHHARPGLRPNPIRERVQVVGYEGGEQYLGSWAAVCRREAERRGWHFTVNGNYDAFDIVVALRVQPGYAARNWKSNVKLANAQGSGTPCIVGQEAAYEETGGTGEIRVSEPNDVGAAFETLAPAEVRREAAARLRAGTVTLERVAREYRGWLETLRF